MYFFLIFCRASCLCMTSQMRNPLIISRIGYGTSRRCSTTIKFYIVCLVRGSFSIYFLFLVQHASADVEKMVLGNKCDINDKRQVSKDRGEKVRMCHCYSLLWNCLSFRFKTRWSWTFRCHEVFLWYCNTDTSLFSFEKETLKKCINLWICSTFSLR